MFEHVEAALMLGLGIYQTYEIFTNKHFRIVPETGSESR